MMKLFFAALVFCALVPFARSSQTPNIIIILSDDMGYSDIGCYGGEITTPNLDKLAAGGVRFTQFYNTARCCPTRASLLTGLYAHQAGIGHMVDAFSEKVGEAYAGDLSPRSVTIAEALEPAGYRSYAVGKWHVCKDITPDGPKHNWPLQRGFDRFYGTITGAGSFYDPGTLARDNTAISPFADAEYRPARFYYTHAISEHAVRFIREHRQTQRDKPFFLYVAYTAAHWPMHALEEDVARQRGRYDAGYEATRGARLARMKQLGLVPPHTALTPPSKDWSKVEHKEWEVRCMEVYAAMVTSMDAGIGQIVAALEESGQLEHTLLCYLQDNGACAETVGRAPKKVAERKAALPPIPAEALRQDVVPKQSRAGIPTRMGPEFMPGPEDTYIAYGEGWANVSNTPFREFKHWVHEGGISTPCIIHWPAGIPKERNNTLEKQPAHLVDLMATVLDVAGAAYPAERDGVPVIPKQGVSLVPALRGQALERSGPLFWEHEGNKAVREGRWKLVAKHNQPWELYDMEEDRTELRDRSAQYPEKVAEMSAKWTGWAEGVGVRPWPLNKK